MKVLGLGEAYHQKRKVAYDSNGVSIFLIGCIIYKSYDSFFEGSGDQIDLAWYSRTFDKRHSN